VYVIRWIKNIERLSGNRPADQLIGPTVSIRQRVTHLCHLIAQEVALTRTGMLALCQNPGKDQGSGIWDLGSGIWEKTGNQGAPGSGCVEIRKIQRRG